MNEDTNKNIKCVEFISFEKSSTEKRFQIIDSVIGDYYPLCCFKNNNCNLKCPKCFLYSENSYIGEEYIIDKVGEKYYFIETCGIIFKTKNFKIC